MHRPSFFLYILPFVIAGAGRVAVLPNERSNRCKVELRPAK
jgi:hypothetical protein